MKHLSFTDLSGAHCGETRNKAHIALKFAALAHPARLQILSRVAGLGACSCKDVVACLDLAQSTVSQHLRILVDAGLLKYSAEGQRSRYEVDRGSMVELSAHMRHLADACCRTPGEA